MREANLILLKPKTAVEKRTHTTVDTIMLTQESVVKFVLPLGQRPLRENAKVLALAERLKQDGGVVPGIITLGILNGIWYIIDGQHRLHAFKLSGLKEGYCDVRFVHATTMREIHHEFVELNSKLVMMRPDDFLRGMEDSIECLGTIRKHCRFIGYDMIRRNDKTSAICSMSVVLRCWRGSGMETPSIPSLSSMVLAETQIEEETKHLIDFMLLAFEGFGRDPEYARLWNSLNLTICMWLYHKLVLMQYSPSTPRLDKATFRKCLMALSAECSYIDFLAGRHMGERDRSPTYNRIKSIFSRRLEEELHHKVKLPAPAWSTA